MYGTGISYEGDLLDTAVNADIIQKSGAWFSYNEEKLGQGRENSKNYLKENPDIAKEIHDKVMAFYQPKPSDTKELAD